METNNLPQLHRIGVVGDRTSLSRSALYREIKAGNLVTVKVGRALRITEAELQRFISALAGKEIETEVLNISDKGKALEANESRSTGCTSLATTKAKTQ